MGLEFREGSNEAKELSSVLYLELMMCCAALAVSTFEEVEGYHGLEAMRELMHRFEPRAALTQTAHSIITNP